MSQSIQPLYALSQQAFIDYGVVQHVLSFTSLSSDDLLENAAHFKRWCGLEADAFARMAQLYPAQKQGQAGDPPLKDLDKNAIEANKTSSVAGFPLIIQAFVCEKEPKNRGEGLDIEYGFLPSLFGVTGVWMTKNALCGLAFMEEGEENACLTEYQKRWPKADFIHHPTHAKAMLERVFTFIEQNSLPENHDLAINSPSLPLLLIGSAFEIEAWHALLSLPFGQVSSYQALAKAINKPKASRAIGRAIGHNPIAAIVPCHRVIGKKGDLTGYHWGLARKQAMLIWEQARKNIKN